MLEHVGTVRRMPGWKDKTDAVFRRPRRWWEFEGFFDAQDTNERLFRLCLHTDELLAFEISKSLGRQNRWLCVAEPNFNTIQHHFSIISASFQHDFSIISAISCSARRCFAFWVGDLNDLHVQAMGDAGEGARSMSSLFRVKSVFLQHILKHQYCSYYDHMTEAMCKGSSIIRQSPFSYLWEAHVWPRWRWNWI
jgi:hypothetical protein